jgi:hypothetical protein
MCEKFVFNRVYEFLEVTGFFYRFRSGFRPGDSTVSQLVYIIHKIYQVFEKGYERGWSKIICLALPWSQECESRTICLIPSSAFMVPIWSSATQLPYDLRYNNAFFNLFKGLKFTSIPSLFEENLEKSSFSGPSEYAKETARQKALEVYHRVKKVRSCIQGVPQKYNTQ